MAELFPQFRRALCVIDTCSIINLDEIILARNDILYYVRQSFDLHVSEIIRDEFNRHRDKAVSREASYWPRVLSTKRFIPAVFTDNLSALGTFYTSAPSFAGAKNAGEHANARVALELFMSGRTGHVIFVTDDQAAVNAFLASLRRSFPAINLWTSIDIVLYVGAILLKDGKAGEKEIEGALRDVYAASAKKWAVLSSEEKSTLIRHQARSVESVKALRRLAVIWRKSHV